MPDVKRQYADEWFVCDDPRSRATFDIRLGVCRLCAQGGCKGRKSSGKNGNGKRKKEHLGVAYYDTPIRNEKGTKGQNERKPLKIEG